MHNKSNQYFQIQKDIIDRQQRMQQNSSTVIVKQLYKLWPYLSQNLYVIVIQHTCIYTL